jgi:hypothetical protein
MRIKTFAILPKQQKNPLNNDLLRSKMILKLAGSLLLRADLKK